MPLTGSEASLKTSMRAAILAANCGAVDGPALTGLVGAIVDTLLPHIVLNAVVSPAGAPLPLTAPPGTAGGPVLGVGSIT
jgi:hypothetical protein